MRFMNLACSKALECSNVETAYNVGAVLVDSASGTVLATGFSRELPGNTHAEECALIKSRALEEGTPLASSTLVMYSTMEPCSVRLSEKAPCCDLLVRAGVSRVVIAIPEPTKFVVCDGLLRLQQAGIEVCRHSSLYYSGASIQSLGCSITRGGCVALSAC